MRKKSNTAIDLGILPMITTMMVTVRVAAARVIISEPLSDMTMRRRRERSIPENEFESPYELNRAMGAMSSYYART
jgi:hypothetical protein